MPEENTTDNQAPIAPELSESPELAEGELSEDDLEAAAGGSAPEWRGHDVANMTLPPLKPPKITPDLKKLFEGP